MSAHRPYERPAIDLTRHAFMREWKDLVVFGTWLANPDQQDEEPCLVIVPRYRRSGFTPAVIALSAAFRYDSARYLARASRQFNLDLGFEDSMANSHKVADAILNHLDDLVRMPPNPVTAVAVGEVTITTGSTKRTGEVLDYVPIVQA